LIRKEENKQLIIYRTRNNICFKLKFYLLWWWVSSLDCCNL